MIEPLDKNAGIVDSKNIAYVENCFEMITINKINEIIEEVNKINERHRFEDEV